MIRNYRWLRRGLYCAAIAAAFAVELSAQAQSLWPLKPTDPNQRQVYLVLKDFSDCTNTDVPNVDSPQVRGNVWVTKGSDGNTTIRVAMTATPKTTYHFFLKCVRLLTDITTDEEGVANVEVSVPTSQLAPVFAFDMYPEGAPLGNKFQSAQVSFR